MLYFGATKTMMKDSLCGTEEHFDCVEEVENKINNVNKRVIFARDRLK